MDHLPPEILNIIVFNLRLDCNALQSLCLVCRDFLPEARRLLYAKIAFSALEDKDTTASGTPYGLSALESTNATKLFTSLTSKPFLAKYIHTFAYAYPRRVSEEFDVYMDDFRTIQASLDPALQLMTNLKELSLLYLEPYLPLLVQGCTFQLESFRYAPTPNVVLKLEDFVTFVQSQPTLKRLSFIGHLFPDLPAQEWPHQIKPTPWLSLEHLGGNIERLLPICPVNSLTLPYNWKRRFITSDLDYRLENIRTLCIYEILRPPSMEFMLGSLMHSFSSLRVLHLSGYAGDQSFLNLPFSGVLNLLNLQYFIQSTPLPGQRGWHSDPNPPDTGDLIRKLRSAEVAGWFKTLQHLEAACFQHKSEIKVDSKCFLVWERGASEAVEIEAEEVWIISPWLP